jgi:hypothetical protein
LSGSVSRFLGDSPLRVFVKLVVLSFLVGFAMHAFGWMPQDVWYALRDAALDIWHMGFDALDRFIGYFVIGAIVVVPIFILIRLLSFRR